MCCWCFPPCFIIKVNYRPARSSSLNKLAFVDNNLTSVSSAILFCGPNYPKGVWQRLMRLCCLTVFTSSPLPLPLLPALGPEVITVCLHTDNNELMESRSQSFSDHSTFDFWTSLLFFVFRLRWYLHVCRRPRVGTRIIPQHALPALVIPAGMSHSPLHSSCQ